jgi:aspartate aminotransferase
MDIISKRAKLIKPSATLQVNKKAAELKSLGRNIISLAVGEPDFDTPQNIKLAAIDAINKGYTKYTNADGIPDLKKAVQQKFKRENNLDYNLDEIIICVGGKGVLYNLFASTIDEGDEVIIPSPYWVSYTEMITLFGGKNVIIETNIEDSFKISPESLEKSITNKTKWLILNSPSNPTGSVYTKSDLEKLSEVLMRHPHVNIVTDDIYEHIIFDNMGFYNVATVNAELKNRTFIVNGLAKAYSMTGWRLGYGAGNAGVIKAMTVMQSQSVTCATSISQYAGVEALNGTQDFIKKNSKDFQDKRDLAFGIISKAFECYKPEGAFYLFPSIKKYLGKKTKSGKIINNSVEFCTELLESKNVAVVPGSAFGNDNYLRISYALSPKDIEYACNKIVDFCSELS